MLVTGLLAATAVAQWFPAEKGNCQHAAQQEFDDGTLKRRCVDADETPIKPEEADLDDKNALCQPAHGNIQCCAAYYGTYTQSDDEIDAGKIICFKGVAEHQPSACPSTEITAIPQGSGDDVRGTTVWCGDDNRIQCPHPYTRITNVGPFLNLTACCVSAFDNCYNENNHCAVADTEHRCCGPPGEDEGTDIPIFVTCTQTESEYCTGEKKWCGDTATSSTTGEPSEITTPNGCEKTGDYTDRVELLDPVNPDITSCCRPSTNAVDCYMPQQEADVCKVATPTYQCCALGQGGVFCTDISTQHECNTPDDNDPTMIFRQWCGDTDTNLEPAAVAAIAATPLLIIAAAAGVAL